MSENYQKNVVNLNFHCFNNQVESQIKRLGGWRSGKILIIFTEQLYAIRAQILTFQTEIMTV